MTTTRNYLSPQLHPSQPQPAPEVESRMLNPVKKSGYEKAWEQFGLTGSERDEQSAPAE